MTQNVNCLVVDDEPLAIRLLEKHIQQIPRLNLLASCWTPMQAFDVIESQSVDLIFLDIQMPGLSGIEFVRSLRNPPSIIFTTAFREYAVESYELDVIDYLVKPITFERFFQSVNRYFASQKRSGQDISFASEPSNAPTFIFVTSNRRKVKVEFEKIHYVESAKDYVCIHLSDDQIMTKDKTSTFEKKLPSNFLRIHRSFIVNVDAITAFTHHDVEIGSKEIPIGISYRSQVKQALERS